MKYYAHSSLDPDKPWQYLITHLENTAQRAKEYAASFNAAEFGYLCGLLHDIGKYSSEFQQKLKGSKHSVDHSSAGAQEALKLYGESIGKLLAYCIAGHHSGLLNHGTPAATEGTLYSRLHKKAKDYQAYKNEIKSLLQPEPLPFPIKALDQNYLGFTLSFFIRMIFSCLVDADFLDTENYMSEDNKPRGTQTSAQQLNTVLQQYLHRFSSPKSRLNMLRNNIRQHCLEMSVKTPGLYSLTVPTGGGKTFSSLAFALNHAQMYNLQRIIYVIPYTSIIEQNAQVFRNVFGAEHVLEHHSNFQLTDLQAEQKQSLTEKLQLASENWDIPIIATTNVQFFESLFSNRSSKCRKIHNMARSVIIFDEAQMLPLQYLRPCLLAISELVYNYGSTAILCTATPPAIDRLLPKALKIQEIMPNPRQLYEDFKKVTVINSGEIAAEDLPSTLNTYEQVLCIVNTRKHAQKVFSALEYPAYHLSTLMCPQHRKETLNAIRKQLAKQKSCRVVSTQLIEAGVDIDFPVVYRALAGLDSIVQSAGRCNREGRLPRGKVYVFETRAKEARVRGYLRRTADIARNVLKKHQDPISLAAIDDYFTLLYDLEGEQSLDKKNILTYLEEGCRNLAFDFQTIAERFKLIESNTYSIIIPYNQKAVQLINEAQYHPYPLSLARKMQPYTVSIYEYEFKELWQAGALNLVNNSYFVLENMDEYYNQETGLFITDMSHGEAIFV